MAEIRLIPAFYLTRCCMFGFPRLARVNAYKTLVSLAYRLDSKQAEGARTERYLRLMGEWASYSFVPRYETARACKAEEKETQGVR